jgi:hypothetical protein
MLEQNVRATFGMYGRLLGGDTSFELHTGQRSLTGQIPYTDVKFLSADDVPIGADAFFWVLSCVLCFVPLIGWLSIPLVYLLRNETVLGVTCEKTYFSLHGSRSTLEQIWLFLEERTGKELHVGLVRAGKASFSDKPTDPAYATEKAVPSAKAVSQPLQCPACGARIQSGDDFCSNCGKKL